MKPKNEITSKGGVLTTTYNQFIPPLVNVIQVNASSKKEVVTCGPTIRGDFSRPNPWNYNVETWNLTDSTWERHYPGNYTASYSGPTNMSFASVLPPNLGRMIDNAYNKALSNFNEKVNGTLNLTVDVIQAGQTAGMINAANGLVQRARTLKRVLKDPRHWRDFLKQAGSVWLEWQYGVMPLVYSMYGILDSLGQDGGDWVRPIRTGSLETYEHNDIQNIMWSGQLALPFHLSGKTEVKCSLSGKIALSGSDPQKVASMNPAVIGWELLPLSFVADWVIDIGGYLANMEAASKNAPSWQFGHHTTVVATNVSGTCSEAPGYNNFSAGFGYQRLNLARVVLPQYPSPRPPQVNVDLGSARLLSAGALLSQTLRSIRFF